jgi:hypothetical protein
MCLIAGCVGQKPSRSWHCSPLMAISGVRVLMICSPTKRTLPRLSFDETQDSSAALPFRLSLCASQPKPSADLPNATFPVCTFRRSARHNAASVRNPPKTRTQPRFVRNHGQAKILKSLRSRHLSDHTQLMEAWYAIVLFLQPTNCRSAHRIEPKSLISEVSRR